MSMLQEFKEFAVKGNVMDLAVGVIIGGAFGKIVDSVVGDLIMPLVGKVLGGLDFSSYYIPLSGQEYGPKPRRRAPCSPMATSSLSHSISSFWRSSSSSWSSR